MNIVIDIYSAQRLSRRTLAVWCVVAAVIVRSVTKSTFVLQQHLSLGTSATHAVELAVLYNL